MEQGEWMKKYYDVLNNEKIIQTDLTRKEIMQLFDIDVKQVNSMCNYGTKFHEQYHVIEAEPDEPITENQAREWNTYIEKFKRRLCS